MGAVKFAPRTHRHEDEPTKPKAHAFSEFRGVRCGLCLYPCSGCTTALSGAERGVCIRAAQPVTGAARGT